MQTERAESMNFFSGRATAVVCSLGDIVHAAPIDLKLFGTLTIMGVLGVLGSICFFTAVKYAPVSTVSHFHYSQLLSGAFVAYYVFKEKPTLYMLARAVVIVISGLYVAKISRASETSMTGT